MLSDDPFLQDLLKTTNAPLLTPLQTDGQIDCVCCRTIECERYSDLAVGRLVWEGPVVRVVYLGELCPWVGVLWEGLME